MDAVGCSNGDTLAKEQVEAATKQDVLKALGKAATSLRAKLGESLASVQKFDVPVEATTASLEALKAFSMGDHDLRVPKEMPKPFRSINVPSNWIRISPWPTPVWAIYGNLGQASLASGEYEESLRSARSSQRTGKIRISALYYDVCHRRTGAGQPGLRTVGQELSAGFRSSGNLG